MTRGQFDRSLLWIALALILVSLFLLSRVS